MHTYQRPLLVAFRNMMYLQRRGRGLATEACEDEIRQTYLNAEIFGDVAHHMRVVRTDPQRSLDQAFSLFMFPVGTQFQSQHRQQNAVVRVDLQCSAKLSDGG